MESKKFVTCPHCKKPSLFSSENPYRPFCCERCRLIDLGKWANEEYKVESKEPVYIEDEDLMLTEPEDNDESHEHN